MPLDGQGPRRRPIAPLDALDDAVLSPGRRAQSRGHVADRLVVTAVDARGGGPEGAMQQAVRLEAQRVAGGGVGVIDGASPALAREVLVQRPAQRDVQGDALPTTVGATRGAHRDDPAHGVEAGEPRSGQCGLETPPQSTRTPYNGMVLSPPITMPSCGYDLGGRCPSYSSTPCARWLESSTTSSAEAVDPEG